MTGKTIIAKKIKKKEDRLPDRRDATQDTGWIYFTLKLDQSSELPHAVVAEREEGKRRERMSPLPLIVFHGWQNGSFSLRSIGPSHRAALPGHATTSRFESCRWETVNLARQDFTRMAACGRHTIQWKRANRILPKFLKNCHGSAAGVSGADAKKKVHFQLHSEISTGLLQCV